MKGTGLLSALALSSQASCAFYAPAAHPVTGQLAHQEHAPDDQILLARRSLAEGLPALPLSLSPHPPSMERPPSINNELPSDVRPSGGHPGHMSGKRPTGPTKPSNGKVSVPKDSGGLARRSPKGPPAQQSVKSAGISTNTATPAGAQGGCKCKRSLDDLIAAFDVALARRARADEAAEPQLAKRDPAAGGKATKSSSSSAGSKAGHPAKMKQKNPATVNPLSLPSLATGLLRRRALEEQLDRIAKRNPTGSKVNKSSNSHVRSPLQQKVPPGFPGSLMGLPGPPPPHAVKPKSGGKS